MASSSLAGCARQSAGILSLSSCASNPTAGSFFLNQSHQSTRLQAPIQYASGAALSPLGFNRSPAAALLIGAPGATPSPECRLPFQELPETSSLQILPHSRRHVEDENLIRLRCATNLCASGVSVSPVPTVASASCLSKLDESVRDITSATSYQQQLQQQSSRSDLQTLHLRSTVAFSCMPEASAADDIESPDNQGSMSPVTSSNESFNSTKNCSSTRAPNRSLADTVSLVSNTAHKSEEDSSSFILASGSSFSQVSSHRSDQLKVTQSSSVIAPSLAAGEFTPALALNADSGSVVGSSMLATSGNSSGLCLLHSTLPTSGMSSPTGSSSSVTSNCSSSNGNSTCSSTGSNSSSCVGSDHSNGGGTTSNSCSSGNASCDLNGGPRSPLHRLYDQADSATATSCADSPVESPSANQAIIDNGTDMRSPSPYSKHSQSLPSLHENLHAMAFQQLQHREHFPRHYHGQYQLKQQHRDVSFDRSTIASTSPEHFEPFLLSHHLHQQQRRQDRQPHFVHMHPGRHSSYYHQDAPVQPHTTVMHTLLQTSCYELPLQQKSILALPKPVTQISASIQKEHSLRRHLVQLSTACGTSAVSGCVARSSLHNRHGAAFATNGNKLASAALVASVGPGSGSRIMLNPQQMQQLRMPMETVQMPQRIQVGGTSGSSTLLCAAQVSNSTTSSHVIANTSPATQQRFMDTMGQQAQTQALISNLQPHQSQTSGGSQSLVKVNSQTKTALANLLSNRLGAGLTQQQTAHDSSIISGALVTSVPSGGSATVVQGLGRGSLSGPQSTTVIQQQHLNAASAMQAATAQKMQVAQVSTLGGGTVRHVFQNHSHYHPHGSQNHFPGGSTLSPSELVQRTQQQALHIVPPHSSGSTSGQSVGYTQRVCGQSGGDLARNGRTLEVTMVAGGQATAHSISSSYHAPTGSTGYHHQLHNTSGVTPSHEAIAATLVGHDPTAEHVTPETCFLGCVFYFTFSRSPELTAEQVALAKDVCLERGGVVVDYWCENITHVVCTQLSQAVVERAIREGKRCVTVYWLNDCVLAGRMSPPWQALHLPTAFGVRARSYMYAHIITSTGFDSEERIRIRAAVTKIGARYTSFMTRENSLLLVGCKRAGLTNVCGGSTIKNDSHENLSSRDFKIKKARDWHIPCVNIQWLSDALFGLPEVLRMPYPHKYQVSEKEMPFLRLDYVCTYSLVSAWKLPIKVTEDHWEKYSSSDLFKRIQKHKQDFVPGFEQSEPKRQRYDAENNENAAVTVHPSRNLACAQPQPVVLLSGFPDISSLRKMVIELGGRVAKDWRNATHLVLTRFSRTVKVMCAISHVKHIVTCNWIQDSFQASAFLDPSSYYLSDVTAEKQFGFSLAHIYTLRRQCAPPPFKGYLFYVTPGCLPPITILRELVEASGGELYLNKRPSVKLIQQVNSSNNSVLRGEPQDNERTITRDINGNTVKFLCVTCESDLYLCKDLIDAAIPLYNVELILTGILRQRLEPEDFLLDYCI